MSEVPREQAGAQAEGPKRGAWASVQEAQASWAGAMRAHKQAPPDPGFRDRLHELSWQRRRCATLTRLRSRPAWRGGPSRTPSGARPPYELRTGTGRRGPHELWTRFGAAVERLNEAGAGDSLSDVVDGYNAVADAASQLADALDEGK